MVSLNTYTYIYVYIYIFDEKVSAVVTSVDLSFQRDVLVNVAMTAYAKRAMQMVRNVCVSAHDYISYMTAFFFSLFCV